MRNVYCACVCVCVCVCMCVCARPQSSGCLGVPKHPQKICLVRARATQDAGYPRVPSPAELHRLIAVNHALSYRKAPPNSKVVYGLGVCRVWRVSG